MKRTLMILSLCLFLLCLCAPAAPAEAPDGAAGTQIIRLTVTGDTLIGCSDRVRRNGKGTYSYDTYIEQNGYAYPFAGLYDMFSADDITLVNLEVVLTDHPNEKALKSHFNFHGPTDFVKILTEGSVEVVNLANNHTYDHGKAAFDETMAALENAGIMYCGSTKGGSYSCIWERDGIRIGFVGILPGYWADGKNAKQNQADVIGKFRALKEAGCQCIVSSIHCGLEYNKKHIDTQVKYEKISRQYGANLIIGNHPHVPQGVHVEKGVTCLYSLGNFTFGGNTGVDEQLSKDALYTFVAQFDLHFENGVYKGHQMTIWPIRISGTYPANNYQPVLVTGEEAERVMKAIQRDSGKLKLNPYVEGKGAVQDFVPWEN